MPALARRLVRYATFVGFYVGNGDSRFAADNLRLHKELTSARVRHTFAVYQGGHTTSLWQQHAVWWLRLGLAHLAGPRT